MKTIHSLYYHNPQPDGVERMIKYHQKLGYRFISLAELYEVLKRKSPVGEKLAFISLDDGWRGNLKLLPIFEKYKVPMCIFVATEPIESGNYWWEYVQKEIGYKKLQEFKNLPYKEFYQKLAEFKKRNLLNRTAMTKEELLKKTFSSAYEAMYALNRFLDDIDKSSINETRSNYQNLRVVGNRIFEV